MPSNIPDGRPLIFLSCAAKNDPYYRDKYQAIIKYHAATASRILGKDNLIVIYCESEARDKLRQLGVPNDILLKASLGDVWLRDPTPAGIKRQAKFKFRPKYLRSKEGKDVEKRIMRALNSVGVEAKRQSELILDGGNVVDNGIDKAVITTRVYDDNPEWSRSEIREELEEKLGMEVAIIPEERGDTTGHSDGIVSFLGSSSLAVTPLEDPYRAEVLESLTDRFGDDVTHVELPGVLVETEWRGFQTACGLHVNTLATHDHLYVPWFSDDPHNVRNGLTQENDNAAVARIKENTSKKVVIIPVPRTMGEMGGSVRCLSFAVDGEMADAAVKYVRDHANQ